MNEAAWRASGRSRPTAEDLERINALHRKVWAEVAQQEHQEQSEQPMYERFTDRARKVMQLANQEAQRFNREIIDVEHVLLGVCKEGNGVGVHALAFLGLDHRELALAVSAGMTKGPDMVTMGKLPQTPRAKKVIEYAIEEARGLNHNWIGTEHLLLGLLRVTGAETGWWGQVTADAVREQIKAMMGSDFGGVQQRWHVTVQQVAPEPPPEVREIAAFMAEAWQRFTAPWKAEVEARFPHLEFDWSAWPVGWKPRAEKVFTADTQFVEQEVRARVAPEDEPPAWKPGKEFL